MNGDECDGRACGCRAEAVVSSEQKNQRAFVTTLPEGDSERPAYPTLLVRANVSDKFIEGRVESLFGRQESGEPHEWAAYDEPADA